MGIIGGGNYAIGEIGGVAPTNGGFPLTVAQLAATPNPNDDPVDQLDYLSYLHDVAWLSQPTCTLTGALTDLAYMNSVVQMDASYDPEASLFAGITTLGMFASITLHGFGNVLLTSPLKAVLALKDAFHDIQYGLQNLPPAELVDALNFIFEPSGDPGVFVFDFAIKTTSFRQELLEVVAMNTLNGILDGGEADNAPLNTGFPFAGTSHYELAYNAITGDLDLLAA